MAYLPLMPQKLAEGMLRYRRRFDPNAAPLGRLGNLEVRLARSSDEVKQAQRLRYRVFYEEMSAVANVRALVSGRDRDPFDRFCDHMLVLDHATDDGFGAPAESVECGERFGRDIFLEVEQGGQLGR